MKFTRNLAMTVLCILLGIMLALQYNSVNYYQSIAAYDNMRLEELKTELITLQNQKISLQGRLEELENENKTYAEVKAGDSEATQQIRNNLKKARIFAGLETVEGKGIIVTLDNYSLVRVRDFDILNVVNELRASGAQAVSVNDERIVAMTEIREAGNYIMINGKQFKAPFTIKAIADPDDLERSLTILGGVLENLESEMLNVSIKKSDEVVINKFIDDSTTIKTDLLTVVQ